MLRTARKIRTSYILAHCFLEGDFEGARIRSPKDPGNDHGGCNVVLPIGIHFPYCPHVDLDTWTGEFWRFLLGLVVTIFN